MKSDCNPLVGRQTTPKLLLLHDNRSSSVASLSAVTNLKPLTLAGFSKLILWRLKQHKFPLHRTFNNNLNGKFWPLWGEISPKWPNFRPVQKFSI
jgi:hypothetical protein